MVTDILFSDANNCAFFSGCSFLMRLCNISEVGESNVVTELLSLTNQMLAYITRLIDRSADPKLWSNEFVVMDGWIQISSPFATRHFDIEWHVVWLHITQKIWINMCLIFHKHKCWKRAASFSKQILSNKFSLQCWK